jgi:superfamily II DNA or RNA helicase
LVEIRIKRWLQPYEFRELLKIADYLGRDPSTGSVFRFNPSKAARNGYDAEDVRNLLSDLGIMLDPSLYDEIKRELDSEGGGSIIIGWDYSSGLVNIKMSMKLYWRIRSIIYKHGCRRKPSANGYYSCSILPLRLHDLIDELRFNGINSFSDESNLLREKPLPYKISLKDIKLRDYQEEALRKWLDNEGLGIIALPTGSGKTIIGIAAIASLNVRTLIITYTREQMFQWRESLYKYTTIEPGHVGVIYSGEKKLGPITITTYQSGYRNIKQLSPLFDMLLVDEVHHLPADKFRYIALHSIARYRMGLSATVVREDGRHEELFPLLGGIVYHRSAAELAQKGYLARHRIITVKVKLTGDERTEYEGLRNLYRSLAGYRPFKEVLDAALKGDANARKALKIHSRMKQIMANSKSKIEKAVEIARKEYEKGNKIIIFTQYVNQAEEIAKKLNAYLLTGEVPTDKRKRTLEAFRNAERGILVVTTVGDEGLDIPDANIGIIVSGTGSRRQFIQRLGRILRPKGRDIEAKLYEIVLSNTTEEYLARKRKKINIDDYTG